MSEPSGQLDALDNQALEHFPGLVVRKDLLRRMRSSFGVPAFVIEFLLGKYCSSTDEDVIREGIEFVRETLAEKFVKPDERERVKSAIKEQSSYEVIDKISATLVETHDKYWAHLANLNIDYVNIDPSEIRKHDRLLMGGIWAEVTLRYDDSFVFKGQNRPFFVEKLRPIQLSSRDISTYLEGRRKVQDRGAWLDLLLRSLGYEPTNPYFTPRRKLLYLLRLVPLVEKNFNLVELGPRGTGKSFVYQQVSPYCHLVSGGQTTVPQMFVNLSTGQRGLVCLWDVVAFDEAAGVRFKDKNGINMMKGYMEDGAFSRGSDIIHAEGSIVFVGNLDGVGTILKTSHLFYPMPREMDAAFYDRIHAYLPGWELQKTRDEIYTDHFGLVTDYLAEVFRELRKRSYADYAERDFRLGAHLSGRDQKAVRKIVSGLVKLLHPDGEVGREHLQEYLELALEMRRRVKEQLKRMAGLEYWDTSFSYADRGGGQETYVGVPESGGGTLILEGALPPGSVYTIGTDAADRRLALLLIQTQINRGSGRVAAVGSLSAPLREAVKTAEAYLKANVRKLGIDRPLESYDFSLQVINLNQSREAQGTAVAFFLALVSALLERPVLEQTVVLGDMSIQGMLLKVDGLAERMQMAVEAGAKRILIPSENKRDVADVPDAVLTQIQWQFYDAPLRAVLMALGLS